MLYMQLFKASKLEHGDLTDELANSMGLFLQKTNIIRDYLEDINEEPAPRSASCPLGLCGSGVEQCELEGLLEVQDAVGKQEPDAPVELRWILWLGSAGACLPAWPPQPLQT